MRTLLLTLTKMGIKRKYQDSLVVQWLNSELPMEGAWVLSLVGELRFHMLCVQ